jgi:LacI family transcriptional regulator
VEEQDILRGDFTQGSGYAMAHKVVRQQPRPTAILAANNFITIGAMKALQETGLEVPEDIALAGFDDLPPALVTFPFFTVVAQPAYEMGRLATERLLQRLGKQAPVDFEEIILPTQLIVRQSSGSAIA